MSIALVTGGNRGLGYATARALARAGRCVILTGRDEARTAKAAAALQEEGLDVLGTPWTSRRRRASTRQSTMWRSARGASTCW